MPPRRRRTRRAVSPLLAAAKAVAREGAIAFALAVAKRFPAPVAFIGVVLVCNELDRTPPRVGSTVEIVQAMPPEPIPEVLPSPSPADASSGYGGGLWAGKVPRQPLPGQRRAPCPRGKTEVEGACWTLTRSRPPCPEDEYEHEGYCMVPALVAKRQPNTLTPEE